MAETHDTIDGLLAEFRGYSAGMPPSYHVTMSWADFRKMLDRLEAAHKRERISPDGEAGAAKRSLEGCDCAKLREALEMVRDAHFVREENGEDCEGFDVEADDGTGRPLICVVEDALAATPRNCDLPEVAEGKPIDLAEQAWRVYKRSHKDSYLDAYGLLRCIGWLLAPATEKEGGNNADE